MTPRWIFVDLDDTLVRADLFVERLARIGLQQPWALLPWLLSGRWSISRLKAEVARIVPLQAAHLPYRSEIVERLQAARAAGAKVVLASATPHAYAEAVATHHGCFDQVVASSADTNLKSRRKLQAIQELTAGEPFAYYGDAACDWPIFAQAAQPVLVSDAPALRRRFQADYPHGETLSADSTPTVRAMVKALRPHQWAKNALLVLPAATGFGLYPWAQLIELGIAVVIFCISSSIVYVSNDMGDVDADRAHPKKRSRPFASGALPIRHGIPLLLGLITLGLGLAIGLLPHLAWMFGVYLAVSIVYSGRLKEIAPLDTFLLSAFYVWRIMVGVAALQIPYSPWFILFFALTFFSLGWLKRYVEILTAKGDLKARRRAYTPEDEPLVLVAGLSSAFCGLIILCIFTLSLETRHLYHHPSLLVLLGVPYLYGMLDLWRDARHGQMDHDPVRHVLGSWKAYLLFAIGLAILLWARLG